jgi:hypothetical protein
LIWLKPAMSLSPRKSTSFCPTLLQRLGRLPAEQAARVERVDAGDLGSALADLDARIDALHQRSRVPSGSKRTNASSTMRSFWMSRPVVSKSRKTSGRVSFRIIGESSGHRAS